MNMNNREQNFVKGRVRILYSLMALLLFAGILTGCSIKTEDILEKEGATEAAKQPYAGHFRLDGNNVETKTAGATSQEVKYYPSEGPVTFIEGDFYGEKIKDEDDALNAVYSIIEDLGGDEDTVLEAETIRPTED